MVGIELFVSCAAHCPSKNRCISAVYVNGVHDRTHKHVFWCKCSLWIYSSSLAVPLLLHSKCKKAAVITTLFIRLQ